ncbi:MAG: prepilin-type N-terminal cleavage/methylation domain-containing protein [Candidatus Omnitrophica bacterium]|nr:prepilin-type N-terminal cleavage/methylation domain-containing protein [Candidatus Omnitrophota bacterium]MDD5574681.1 prepilin-type N-terminal cleavage/methylation domain-containing protein [Candidatus Omnitrophota bacterium]
MEEKRRASLTKNRRGFTLIEFVGIVILMGILASIALPLMIKGTERARVNEAKTILGTLRRAQLRYAVRYAVYTSDSTLLDVNLPPAKYFTYSVFAGTDLDGPTVAVASATRTALESFQAISCRFNVTAGGNFTANTTQCMNLI